MAITSTLIGSFGAGGGKVWASIFTTNRTVTLGEAGKNYIVSAKRNNTSTQTTLYVNGTDMKITNTAMTDVVATGPVTLEAAGSSSGIIYALVVEATPI